MPHEKKNVKDYIYVVKITNFIVSLSRINLEARKLKMHNKSPLS